MKTRKLKHLTTYDWISNVIMSIWVILIIIPFLLLLMSSITDENTLVRNGYSLFPAKFSLESYAYIFKSGAKIFKAYGISILVTAVGTLINVFLSALLAYPLTVKNLPGRKVITFIVFFTMLFNGGIVPSYVIWTTVFKIKDTIWAQLIPNLLMSAWNVMMIRTYYTSNISESYYEAARIDGASEFNIFANIVIPLGKPILVTIGTFAGLGYWNNWTNGAYFLLKNKDLYNVQNLLNEMSSNIQYLATAAGDSADVSNAAAKLPAVGIQMAIAFVAILPIMVIFPFFHKFYAKGITLGGVKG